MTLVPPSAPRAIQREMKPRAMWAAGVVSLAFLALIFRLYQLQILQGEDFREQAENNVLRDQRLPADRGMICDRHGCGRNGQILVDSRPSYNVVLMPPFCGKQCEDVLSRVATMLSMSQEEIERARKRLADARRDPKQQRASSKSFTIKVDISREELDIFEANKTELSGVEVVATPHRNYRFGTQASHLFGYTNEVRDDELEAQNATAESNAYQMGDYIGRRGLERSFERELRGAEGKRPIVVDAKGNAKSGADLDLPEQEEQPPKPGANLILSIDWRLQEFAEKTFPGKAGVVLAMDPRTGFILAMVDRPAADPNKLSGRITTAELSAIHSDPLQPELFRAIQQHYHPGSTFKVVTAIAALEEGVFRRMGTVFCPGYFRLGNHRWRCDKESGHGSVDLTHALGASCDVFFYSLGDRLGADKIAKWGSKLGLGRPTGFDIPGEVPGIMPDEEWHRKHIAGGYHHGMAVNIAIGQGDLNVTPMQQLVLYGALASGIVWKPQAVLRLESAQGEVIKEFAPKEMGRIPIRKETHDAVVEGLKAAVNSPFGTAYASRFKDSDVVMAGKTGTAQVVKLGAKRLKASQMEYFSRDHAWFAAFAPVEDPQIVVVVLNEHSGFGSSNAAPTAAAVIQYWLELQKQDAAARAGLPPPNAASSAPAQEAKPEAVPVKKKKAKPKAVKPKEEAPKKDEAPQDPAPRAEKKAVESPPEEKAPAGEGTERDDDS